jgi:hypothetical protein
MLRTHGSIRAGAAKPQLAQTFDSMLIAIDTCFSMWTSDARHGAPDAACARRRHGSVTDCRRLRLKHSEAPRQRSEAKRPCHSRARSCGEPRGTAGTDHGCNQGYNTTPSQVGPAAATKKPELPKLRAQAPSSRAGRRDLLWSTTWQRS